MPTDLEVSEELAIRRLLAMYCQLADDYRIDEWLELFTSDGELAIGGLCFSGHEELRRFIEPSKDPNTRGKHLISEPWIEIDGANRLCLDLEGRRGRPDWPLLRHSRANGRRMALSATRNPTDRVESAPNSPAPIFVFGLVLPESVLY